MRILKLELIDILRVRPGAYVDLPDVFLQHLDGHIIPLDPFYNVVKEPVCVVVNSLELPHGVKFCVNHLFDLLGHNHPGGLAPDLLEPLANCLAGYTKFSCGFRLILPLLVNQP